ncbi:uncharacterized protein LY89DRAFT_72644 [Mollisia scopiformis]|uniref:Uncharacterized protein n=1 Tax=Mollisia scopiformis TaxID=149040 RepID=A0A194XAE1_MOLSC|nr:uncharacterized protein LY89DRAFT_72644 [Mollisia scopiformis]KUJ17131.1 hypothetical protein LY89DRAFT_72644 [Mollisia scopiformis]
MTNFVSKIVNKLKRNSTTSDAKTSDNRPYTAPTPQPNDWEGLPKYRGNTAQQTVVTHRGANRDSYAASIHGESSESLVDEEDNRPGRPDQAGPGSGRLGLHVAPPPAPPPPPRRKTGITGTNLNRKGEPMRPFEGSILDNWDKLEAIKAQQDAERPDLEHVRRRAQEEEKQRLRDVEAARQRRDRHREVGVAVPMPPPPHVRRTATEPSPRHGLPPPRPARPEWKRPLEVESRPAPVAPDLSWKPRRGITPRPPPQAPTGGLRRSGAIRGDPGQRGKEQTPHSRYREDAVSEGSCGPERRP